MKRLHIMLAGAGALLVAFVVAALTYTQWQEQRELEELARQPTSLFKRPHSPTYGSPSARVKITEFFDPACETCSAFFPIVKDIVDRSSGRVQLVVRYVPFHAGADQAVKLLDAARLQGQFWPVARQLLRQQSTWGADHNPRPDLIWGLVEGMGLDMERLRTDATSEQVLAHIEQDMADARTLKVTRTPGFFVNGRALKDFGQRQLEDLVREEMKRAYGNDG